MSATSASRAPGQPDGVFGNPLADTSGDAFEIAVEDLRGPRRRGNSAASPEVGASPLASPLARREAWRARLWRQTMGVLLVLLVVPSLFPNLNVSMLAALLPSGGGSVAAVGRLQVAAVAPLAPLLRDPRWTLLEQRPLELAALAPGAACPVTPGHLFAVGMDPGQGTGPVYATAPGADQGALLLQPPSSLGARGQGWAGQKVIWFVGTAYQGPVLIRGRRLDGPGQLRFNGGLDQEYAFDDLADAPLLAALRLEGDSSAGEPWPGWPSYARVRTPGCYAYQVDGLNFTEIIIFQALGGV